MAGRRHARGGRAALARWRAWLGAALSACALAACGGGADTPRLVLFVSLDTLRRDALGVYREGAGDLTPELDALAREAVVFRSFGVQVPFTLPSHLSMLTGVYPGVHGVNTAAERLDPRLTTLAEVLQRAGWATHGVVTNLWMKGEFGFARGFDSYERLEPGRTYAGRVNARALERIDAAQRDGRPLLLFLHYMDAHSDFDRDTGDDLPYHAPPPWGEGPGSGRFALPDGRRATAFLEAANRGEVTIDADAAAELRRLYEQGVRALDHELGRLFAALRERGLWERSLVLVTSDHGEEFGEHGRFLHDQPYEECVAAPLLLRLPGGRMGGTEVDALCESIDLMPTVLDAAGLEPPEAIQGRSLLPVVTGERPGRATVLSRDKRVASRYALRDERHKLVWDFATGRGELYDLQDDPGELRDISAREPEVVRRLRERLEALARSNDLLGRHLAGEAGPGEQVLDAEERRILRSLGYFSDDD